MITKEYVLRKHDQFFSLKGYRTRDFPLSTHSVIFFSEGYPLNVRLFLAVRSRCLSSLRLDIGTDRESLIRRENFLLQSTSLILQARPKLSQNLNQLSPSRLKVLCKLAVYLSRLFIRINADPFKRLSSLHTHRMSFAMG